MRQLPDMQVGIPKAGRTHRINANQPNTMIVAWSHSKIILATLSMPRIHSVAKGDSRDLTPTDTVISI